MPVTSCGSLSSIGVTVPCVSGLIIMCERTTLGLIIWRIPCFPNAVFSESKRAGGKLSEFHQQQTTSIKSLSCPSRFPKKATTLMQQRRE
jgi:hypothetical protein